MKMFGLFIFLKPKTLEFKSCAGNLARTIHRGSGELRTNSLDVKTNTH